MLRSDRVVANSSEERLQSTDVNDVQLPKILCAQGTWQREGQIEELGPLKFKSGLGINLEPFVVCNGPFPGLAFSRARSSSFMLI